MNALGCFGLLVMRALSSLRSTPSVTLLAVLATALGTAIPTGIASLRQLYTRDPIPEQSDLLHYVRLDSWSHGQRPHGVAPGEPPNYITYRDMQSLLEAPVGRARTGVGNARAIVHSTAPDARPEQAEFRLCHSDFFTMFRAPFAHGSSWSRQDDIDRRRVAVLSHAANARMFGGEDSVGRTVRLEGGTLEVIGVLGPWQPTPQFYDVINSPMAGVRDFFVPFDLVRDPALGLDRSGDSASWGPRVESNDPDAEFTRSERAWIQFWTRLDGAEELSAYDEFLAGHAEMQRRLGRFPSPNNHRVTPLMSWMKFRNIVPQGTLAILIVGLMFMVMCALNASSLLFSKYISEQKWTGVARALGASRRQIFVQRIFECQLVGLLGGALGVLFAHAMLFGLAVGLPRTRATDLLLEFNPESFLIAAGFAVTSGLIAGVYPAYRAAFAPPAHQLAGRE